MSSFDQSEMTQAQRRLMERVFWRVMPFVTACMVIGTIDRSNVGFAKISMAGDLGMSEAVFAFGASLFYLGYILFEIPGALGVHRYGARLWFARIMFTWGLTTLALAFTTSATMFYLLRFFLGVAEAGLYPGLIYYITLWVPKAYYARAVGMLTIGSALGNGLGALVAGPLLDMNGTLGFTGWQWIFFVSGGIPIIGTIILLLYMPDRIERATFLTEEEKAQVAGSLDPEKAKQHHGFRDVLHAIVDPKVLGHGIGFIALLTALYGVIYWMPSVVKTFGVTGTQNGLLVALPWGVNAVLLWLIPTALRGRDNLVPLIMVLLAGSAAFAAAVAVDSPAFRYAMLFVGIPAISVGMALYWTFPARLFHGAQAAVALATITSIGNFGGLVGQNLMPAVAQAGGSPAAAMLVPSAGLALFALGGVVAWVRRRARAV